MSIEKTSGINQIEITNSGTIQVRFALHYVDNNVPDAPRWHRTTFNPSQDVDAQMSAVNAHLSAMGWPPINDYQAIKDHAAIAWTPEVIAAYQSAQDT